MRASLVLLALLAEPLIANATETALTFTDARGEPVEIRAEPERALLLHFWASWCPDCAEDLAHLDAAAAKCGKVRTVAVNAAESQAQVEAYLAQHPLRIDVVRDPSGEVWRRLDGRGLPMNAYWSAGGQKTDVGPKSRAQWVRLLASLGCE